MTPDEICQWLGVPPGTELLPALITELEPLPVPTTDMDHVATFRHFLRVMPRPRKVVQGHVQG